MPDLETQDAPASDSPLVPRARDGDRAACRELYRRHSNGIFTLACRMTGDRAEAEDLTQEVFIHAFRGLCGFRGESSFSTWLYRIAINHCRSRLRRRRPGELVPLERADVGTEPQRAADLRLLLERAVGELPEGYREVFVLHDVQGMGHGEIAEILGCSAGTVRSQLWKARGRLREMIGPHLKGEGYEVPGLGQEAAEPAG